MFDKIHLAAPQGLRHVVDWQSVLWLWSYNEQEPRVTRTELWSCVEYKETNYITLKLGDHVVTQTPVVVSDFGNRYREDERDQRRSLKA